LLKKAVDRADPKVIQSPGAFGREPMMGARGAASPVKPKFVSRSDPAAQWTGAHKGHAFFTYSTNYLIDLDHAVIVDVEPSRLFARLKLEPRGP
jgi:hypothetical protein